ncbi:MAG: hypothetical protein U5K43_04550 [Halofilum sp. (in: g-proteobacteria)]|nr:hypothetical protein [Halofilum sp. (in: g-proteobacteria)]
MRTRTILHIAAFLGGVLALGPVHAASITLSGGRVDPGDGYDSTTTANVRVAAELLDLGVAELDAGVEAAQSTTRGDGPLASDYGFTSVGAFVGARTAGPLYLIGRYGVARNEIDLDPGPDERETQQSVGVGIGASAGILQLELMATRYLEAGDIEDVTWVTAGGASLARMAHRARSPARCRSDALACASATPRLRPRFGHRRAPGM